MTVVQLLRCSIVLTGLLVLLGGCREDQAARAEREAAAKVAKAVQQQMTAERHRTWRIVGFGVLGAAAITCMICYGRAQSLATPVRSPVLPPWLPGPQEAVPRRIAAAAPVTTTLGRHPARVIQMEPAPNRGNRQSRTPHSRREYPNRR